MRNTIKIRLEQGVCVQCGKRQPEKNKQKCVDCAKKNSDYHKERKSKLKKENLCVSCGKVPPINDGGVTCRDCRNQQIKTEKKRRKRLKKSGLCTRCGMNPQRKNGLLCEKCRQRQRERKWDGNHKAVLERDSFRCQICNHDKRLEVHHIDGNGERSNDPNHDMKNLITICKICHRAITLLASNRCNTNLAIDLVQKLIE